MPMPSTKNWREYFALTITVLFALGNFGTYGVSEDNSLDEFGAKSPLRSALLLFSGMVFVLAHMGKYTQTNVNALQRCFPPSDDEAELLGEKRSVPDASYEEQSSTCKSIQTACENITAPGKAALQATSAMRYFYNLCRDFSTIQHSVDARAGLKVLFSFLGIGLLPVVTTAQAATLSSGRLYDWQRYLAKKVGANRIAQLASAVKAVMFADTLRKGVLITGAMGEEISVDGTSIGISVAWFLLLSFMTILFCANESRAYQSKLESAVSDSKEATASWVDYLTTGKTAKVATFFSAMMKTGTGLLSLPLLVARWLQYINSDQKVLSNQSALASIVPLTALPMIWTIYHYYREKTNSELVINKDANNVVNFVGGQNSDSGDENSDYSEFEKLCCFC